MHQHSWKTKLQISASDFNAKRAENLSEIFHQNTFMTDNLLLWIQNRHSPEINGIKGRMGKAQILRQTRQRRNGSGEGEDLSIAFLGVILSEELAEQQPPGQQGPGHRSAAPEGPLRQPNQAGDFTALGKKWKQENFPIKVSLMLMQPGEKRPVWALVLIFTTQSFSPALPADKMCMLQERTVGKPQ